MTILVTGATGNIGRLVVDHLLAAGVTDVRALTVDPGRAELPPDVDVVVGSLHRPASLTAAFAGVERMYLAPTPGTAVDVLTLARLAGVRHVVDLSGEPESWWGAVTGAVEASGLAWTHLWPGDFMENTLTWAPQIRATAAVREPHPDGASVPIAMDDIAAVAARALFDDRYVGEALALTGPEVLTRRAGRAARAGPRSGAGFRRVVARRRRGRPRAGDGRERRLVRGQRARGNGGVPADPDDGGARRRRATGDDVLPVGAGERCAVRDVEQAEGLVAGGDGALGIVLRRISRWPP